MSVVMSVQTRFDEVCHGYQCLSRRALDIPRVVHYTVICTRVTHLEPRSPRVTSIQFCWSAGTCPNADTRRSVGNRGFSQVVWLGPQTQCRATPWPYPVPAKNTVVPYSVVQAIAPVRTGSSALPHHCQSQMRSPHILIFTPHGRRRPSRRPLLTFTRPPYLGTTWHTRSLGLWSLVSQQGGLQ